MCLRQSYSFLWKNENSFFYFFKNEIVYVSPTRSRFAVKLICWIPFRLASAVSCLIPNKNLVISKTSWKRLQGICWRNLENVFSVTTSKKSLRHLANFSWWRLRKQKILTLKTSSRRLQDISSRHLQDIFWGLADQQNVCWEGIYISGLTNLNLYPTSLYLIYLTNLRWILHNSKMH